MEESKRPLADETPEEAILVSLDTGEFDVEISLDELEDRIPRLLQAVHDGLYEKALARRESMTYTVHTLDEMKETADRKPGLIRAMWCGDLECELKLKEEAGVSSRCMPFEQEAVGDRCVCCGKPAKKLVVWGKAY